MWGDYEPILPPNEGFPSNIISVQAVWWDRALRLSYLPPSPSTGPRFHSHGSEGEPSVSRVPRTIS